jgi:formylglycine-generating enzyme required for sulfatase activity
MILCFSDTNGVLGNGILLGNANVHDRNSTEQYTILEFDIRWDNGFRTTTEGADDNWDAAWVFIKWRKTSEPTAVWSHGTLKDTGHTVPRDIHSESPTEVSYTYSLPADLKGIFIHRSDTGSTGTGYGDTRLRDIRIAWDYGSDGLQNEDEVDIHLFAIEMVYVPEGNFYLGSGGSESGSFTDGSWSSGAPIPFQITSEAAITLDPSAGNLWGTSTSGTNTIGSVGTLPAAFPKGYQAFYMMRYEISQSQYADFLNHLDRAQQDARTVVDISSGTTSVANRYVLTDSSGVHSRNGISCASTIDAIAPVTFFCDLDGDGTGNENNDGLNIACNFLRWSDLSAYLDWTALRPMTELEYEKACRGPAAPTANEFAWGTASIHGTMIGPTSRYMLSDQGTSSEDITNSRSTFLGYAMHHNTLPLFDADKGPLRTGIFANSSTNQSNAGGSYWGIMELSGNIWETVINVGVTEGRNYTGLHGDGNLAASGEHDVDYWPWDPVGYGQGIGGRGGFWWSPHTFLTASTRIYAVSYSVINTTTDAAGGRGVRTAP